MLTIIANQIGRIHHAAGDKSIQVTRPVYAFVPEEFFSREGGMAKNLYLTSRWPGINAGANPMSVGSHVFPDAEKPANIRSRCPILKEFLNRLEEIAIVKTTIAA